MNKSLILLIAREPILNMEKVKLLENLNAQYSVLLNSLLFSNWIEIFASFENDNDIYYFTDLQDKEFIPRNFIRNTENILFQNADSGKRRLNIEGLQITNYNKLLYVCYNSIGITEEDINKAFNLLSFDEKSIVIGKSQQDRIAFVATNISSVEFLTQTYFSFINYNQFLNQISKEDILLHIINNFLSVVKFQDFKKLYIELSKKDSLLYCSEIMHERFNDLFVEYKELLNE